MAQPDTEHPSATEDEQNTTARPNAERRKLPKGLAALTVAGLIAAALLFPYAPNYNGQPIVTPTRAVWRQTADGHSTDVDVTVAYAPTNLWRLLAGPQWSPLTAPVNGVLPASHSAPDPKHPAPKAAVLSFSRNGLRKYTFHYRIASPSVPPGVGFCQMLTVDGSVETIAETRS